MCLCECEFGLFIALRVVCVCVSASVVFVCVFLYAFVCVCVCVNLWTLYSSVLCLSVFVCLCLLCLPVYLYVPLCVCVCVYVCLHVLPPPPHWGREGNPAFRHSETATQDSSTNSPMDLHMLTLLRTHPEMLISTQMYPHQSSHSFNKHLWSTYCVPGHIGPGGQGRGGNTAGLKPLTLWVNTQRTGDTGPCEGYCDEENQREKVKQGGGWLWRSKSLSRV